VEFDASTVEASLKGCLWMAENGECLKEGEHDEGSRLSALLHQRCSARGIKTYDGRLSKTHS
jgi:hypothetical protein